MTKDNFIASFKYSLLQHAQKHKNITYTCRTFNISRTVYYKWLKRFNKLGYLGLQDKEKSKFQMPNRVKPNKEKIILNYIIDYPTHKPKRITNELSQKEMKISETGVCNALRKVRKSYRIIEH